MRALPLALGLFAMASTFEGEAAVSALDAAPPALIQRFLETPVEPLSQFRAFRRLEASNSRFGARGWIEVMTEQSPDAGFSYQVLDEGGSGYIRKKVLRPILEGERDIVARGDPQRSAITTHNYDITGDTSNEPGIARLRLTPLRREITLLDGVVVVAERDVDVIRVEGRLARNPSFWTRRVDVVRRYGRIGGVRVPVSTESVAQVRVAGPSVVRITYRYEMVNGRAVVDEADERPYAEGEGGEH